MDREKLLALREECLACRKCQIGGRLLNASEDGQVRLANVFSSMAESAQIMVCGQNPGAEEVQQGVPFVGRAGKVFDEALKEIVGLERKDLYVCNVCHCYTPANRKPLDTELDNCRSFLDREIELVAPKLIIALGGIAFKQLTGMSGIMKHHGEVLVSIKYKVPVICVLHPSPLNTNNPERNAAFRSDLQKVKEFLDGRA